MMNEVKYNFSKNNFVVTGASSGMGRQIVIELAEAGAIVLAIARREKELRSLQKNFPQNIFIGIVDVCDAEKLEKVILEFVNLHGKINGSVHAAGIFGLTPIKFFNDDMARKIMDISFWAGIKLIQICTKNKYCTMESSHVLFSSISGQTADKGLFAYASAKAAMKVAIKSIAKEISGKKHRINTISPGWVKSNLTDNAEKTIDVAQIIEKHLLGEGMPEDVSGVVLFLLSNRAKWITGTDIVVDGGYLA